MTVGEAHRDEPGLRPSQKVKPAIRGQDQEGPQPGRDSPTAYPRQGARTRAALCRGSQGKWGGPSRLPSALLTHSSFHSALILGYTPPYQGRPWTQAAKPVGQGEEVAESAGAPRALTTHCPAQSVKNIKNIWSADKRTWVQTCHGGWQCERLMTICTSALSGSGQEWTLQGTVCMLLFCQSVGTHFFLSQSKSKTATGT